MCLKCDRLYFMKIEFIDTDIGEKIIKDLKRFGWRLIDEYPMVFDKGIDYDFYTLERENLEMKFEWTNWFEWEVSGSDESLVEISERYKLEIKT
jgi:hypothetical protein